MNVIGLNYEQTKQLAKAIIAKTDECGVLIGEDTIINCIRRYLRSQKFKTGVAAIDWSLAPKNATQVQLLLDFYDQDQRRIRCTDVLTTIDRTEPMILPEQTWTDNVHTYEVLAIVNIKGGEHVVCLSVADGQTPIYSRTYFLANFTRRT